MIKKSGQNEYESDETSCQILTRIRKLKKNHSNKQYIYILQYNGGYLPLNQRIPGSTLLCMGNFGILSQIGSITHSIRKRYRSSSFDRGVQRLNSIQDKRELFFKNRMTNLMLKPTVVKSLSSPVKKKEPVKQEISPVINIKRQQVTVKSPIVQEHNLKNNLAKKKKQMQMRLTYQAEEHSPDALNKLITQHHNKATTLTTKIQQIIQENNRKVEERIKARKLRTLTAKSRSDYAMNEPKQFVTEKNIVETIDIIKEENQQNIKKKNKMHCRKLSMSQERVKIQNCNQIENGYMKNRKRTFSFHDPEKTVEAQEGQI